MQRPSVGPSPSRPALKIRANDKIRAQGCRIADIGFPCAQVVCAASVDYVTCHTLTSSWSLSSRRMA